MELNFVLSVKVNLNLLVIDKDIVVNVKKNIRQRVGMWFDTEIYAQDVSIMLVLVNGK